MSINVEYTDLFGGELNYSWVRRLKIEDPNTSIRNILKQARSEFGISCKLHKTHDYGDSRTYKLDGYHRAITVEWEY